MIGIHNYEEYFLMYVDNELSPSEREMVEKFVTEHPELAEELEGLSSVVLPMEDAVFVPKTELFKLDSRLEEESMLLHLDNELEPSLAASLEKDIKGNEEAAREWELLKRTKLDRNEKIEFRDKVILFRKEPASIISMKFFRYAAAAVLIGAALFFGIKISGNDPSKQTPNIASEKPKPVVPGTEKPAEILAQAPKEETSEIPAEEMIVEKAPDVQYASNSNPEKKSRVVPAPGKVNETQETIEPLRREDMVIYRNEAPEMLRLASNEKPVVNKPVDIIDRDMTQKPESYALLASLEDEDDEEVLYMNEEKVSRSKVGRVFRKVKRVVERRTNINTPDGIRIGGFEIALK